jgi:hypothetical protein
VAGGSGNLLYKHPAVQEACIIGTRDIAAKR